jgi:hypothetical protein
MTMEQWGDASQVVNGNGGTGLPKSLEDSGNLERVPQPKMALDTKLKQLALFMISW